MAPTGAGKGRAGEEPIPHSAAHADDDGGAGDSASSGRDKLEGEMGTMAGVRLEVCAVFAYLHVCAVRKRTSLSPPPPLPPSLSLFTRASVLADIAMFELMYHNDMSAALQDSPTHFPPLLPSSFPLPPPLRLPPRTRLHPHRF